jgi:hypothetical protein
MRLLPVTATVLAVALLAFGALATRAAAAPASPPKDGDQGGASSALSYRARVVAPSSAQRRALRVSFARTHRAAVAGTPMPRTLLAAMHRRVLWALATFALDDGTIVVERFRRRPGEGWRDLGATRARCPGVPPEVRGVWRLTACQTA